MPAITVDVDDDLEARMEEHPEVDWSEVARQALRETVEVLDVMDERTDDSELTEDDVAELAEAIDGSARSSLEERSE